MIKHLGLEKTFLNVRSGHDQLWKSREQQFIQLTLCNLFNIGNVGLTQSSGGTGPGSMLFAAEYKIGTSLSP